MIKKITAVILLILGVGFYVLGTYVSSEVTQGEKKITRAQKNVNRVQGLTNISPYTKDVGKAATSPIQKKIDEGKQVASKYKGLSSWFHGGGIALFIIGSIFLIRSIYTKRSR